LYLHKFSTSTQVHVEKLKTYQKMLGWKVPKKSTTTMESLRHLYCNVIFKNPGGGPFLLLRDVRGNLAHLTRVSSPPGRLVEALNISREFSLSLPKNYRELLTL